MSYNFAEASKDAERIENFLQRLAKARAIFDLVSEAKVRIEQLRAEERSIETDLKHNRSRYTSAKTLSDEKIKAFGELTIAASDEAAQAQADVRAIIDALHADVTAARASAKEAKDKLTARAEQANIIHAERVVEMETIERDKRAQIADAESKRRAIIQQLSPSGD